MPPQLGRIDFDHRTRTLVQPGGLDSLGELVAPLGSRALLVTDRGLRAAGHLDRATASLQDAGVSVSLYDAVTPNPTTDDVDACAAFARGERVDVVVGLGGGSSMDCAKGTLFLLAGGGTMHDYKGVGRGRGEFLPLVAVPTTAGTGSEAQSFAVIADAQTHLKMACGDKRAAARIALLDPELTLTMPWEVTVLTGLDAISHALETLVTKPASDLSRMFSREAWRLLAGGFDRVLTDAVDAAAREDMLLGAHLAGMAIECSMLGAAHALANPLTARFGVAHGQAVSVMLPHVIRFNAESGVRYDGLGLSVDQLVATVHRFTARGGLKTHLSDLGVTADAVEAMAEDARGQWTGTFNPRQLTAGDAATLYRAAMRPLAATAAA